MAILAMITTTRQLDAGLIAMDFDSGSGNNVIWQEDGFQVTAISSGSGNNHFDRGDFFNDTSGNELYLHNGNNAEEIRFDLVSGDNFDLASLDVDAINGNWVSISSSSGATQAISSTGTLGFSGTDWQNISYFTIRSTVVPAPNNHFIAIDNVIIDDEPTLSGAVPEPGSLAIFGICSLGLMTVRRRKRS